MKKIKKELKVQLIIAIIISVLYVAAIPGLILSIGKITWLMIVCIAYLGIGFYANPIVWIKYGDKVSLQNVVKAVSEEIYDVESIALQTGKDVQTVVGQVRLCIDKGYIRGLLFDGKALSVNEKAKSAAERRCPNCGATLVAEDNVLKCGYCGYVYHDKN